MANIWTFIWALLFCFRICKWKRRLSKRSNKQRPRNLHRGGGVRVEIKLDRDSEKVLSSLYKLGNLDIFELKKTTGFDEFKLKKHLKKLQDIGFVEKKSLNE